MSYQLAAKCHSVCLRNYRFESTVSYYCLFLKMIDKKMLSNKNGRAAEEPKWRCKHQGSFEDKSPPDLLFLSCTGHSLAIALVSNCPRKHSILVRAISATGAQLLFDTGSAGAIATECPVSLFCCFPLVFSCRYVVFYIHGPYSLGCVSLVVSCESIAFRHCCHVVRVR